jgi:hypothetical protein
MNRLFLAAALVAAIASAPFAVPRRGDPAPARSMEIVSAPARPAPAFAELDLKSAWGTCVALHLAGIPHPPEAGPKFVEAFFDGRLPEAAKFVAAQIAGFDAQRSVRIADRARNLDRALSLLPSAPDTLLLVFIERAEDPLAHVEAVRAHAEAIARLVADPALGQRAFDLLVASGAVASSVCERLADRVARDAWARKGLGDLGAKSIPSLLLGLNSADPARRAASAWVLAGIDGPRHAEVILRAALPELARDSVPGNAAFAVRALSTLGDRARPAVLRLLKSDDDQVVAAAIQVLMKTGGANIEDVNAARPRVDRLAAGSSDEASIALEVRAALGVTPGALKVPDPPEKLNVGQTW